jgi:hypothetical protein
MKRVAKKLVAYREWVTKFGGCWEYHEPDNLPAGYYDLAKRMEPLYTVKTANEKKLRKKK